MKFSHIADCHLGSWRQPELNQLNFESFKKTVEVSIKEKVDFVLIAGDLFDSAYPSIDILKETFRELRRLKESNIPVFLIAGSHDYSVSGKTFLDVLEKAGLCKNVTNFEERGEKIYLYPTIEKNVAIYGYPGKKSGLEVDEVKRTVLHEAPGLFRILMLHTTLRDAVSNPLIKSVDKKDLPKADYTAMGHLHLHYNKDGIVYPGPTFPNTISELEDLNFGSFCIVDNNLIKRHIIKLKEVSTLKLNITNAIQATERILEEIEKLDLSNKILILKLYGILQNGKVSDIDFTKLEKRAKEKGAFVFLKSTSQIHSPDAEFKVNSTDTDNLEQEIITQFIKSNPNSLNSLIPSLMKTLQAEKLEDERSSIFEDRLLSEAKKVIKYENKETLS